MSSLFSLLLLVLYVILLPVQVFADSKPLINEFLPHPGTSDKEWVELYVPDGIDLTNYWIDDDTDFVNDSGSSDKKKIISVVQGSDSRHVIFELSSSMFNNSGDTVALFAPDGTLIDHYEYKDDPGTNVSIGRTPDATGDFHVLSFATRGSPNSNPKPPDTATPEPTDKPTKEPKPTETPKPAKNTSVPTVAKSDENVLADSTYVPTAKKSITSPTLVSSEGAQPTAILAVNTKTPDKKVFRFSKTQVLVKGTTNEMPRIIAFSIGGLLLAGCGILLYLKKQGLLPWQKKE